MPAGVRARARSWLVYEQQGRLDEAAQFRVRLDVPVTLSVGERTGASDPLQSGSLACRHRSAEIDPS